MRSASSKRAPRLHAGVHLRLEEAIDAAAVGLGAVERHVGVLQELVGVGAVGGRERDADAGVDHHHVAVNVVGRADRLGDAPGQPLRVGGIGDVGLDDGELVAADARDGVGFAHAAAQPAGHHPQQLVAGRMAERVVDVLELVEIETQHREPLAALDMGQRFAEALAQQQAVRQVGESVVARHVGDLHFRAPPLGDVLVGRDPAAAVHRLTDHRDGASVLELDELAESSCPAAIAALSLAM